jgi:TonB family protein
MLRKRTLVALLSCTLALALPALGQTASAPVPTPANGPHYGLPRAHIAADILSHISPADRKVLTQSWLLPVRQKLLMSWRPLLPNTARRPMREAGTDVLTLQLGPTGVVRSVRAVRSNGDPALLKSAEGALKSASPYPPFPPGVKARSIRLRLTFRYD